MSVFLSAAHYGQINIVETMLKMGIDVETKDCAGSTALMLACMEGEDHCGDSTIVQGHHYEVVKALLDAGAYMDGKGDRGMTALMFSSECGNAKIVKKLLAKGAEVNTTTDEGWTALMAAIFQNWRFQPWHRDTHLEIVQILLEEGADSRICTIDGETALDFARKGGHTKIERILKNRSMPPPHLAMPSPEAVADDGASTAPQSGVAVPSHQDDTTVDSSSYDDDKDDDDE